MNDDDLLRYSRQLLLPEIDIAGQQRLLDARVALFGLGGLGAPVALYLAAAGIGTLHLCDPDTVDLTNLQRQVLFRSSDRGELKVTAAARELAALNPGPRLRLHPQRLQGDELTSLCGQVDLVIDGTDNFLSRDAINSACLQTRTPLLFGAAIRWEGQLALFDPRDSASPCYRCLHPASGDGEDRCAESGVAGPVVGTIGTLLAVEALKLITGAGTTRTGELLHYDALDGRFERFRLPRFAACPSCG